MHAGYIATFDHALLIVIIQELSAFIVCCHLGLVYMRYMHDRDEVKLG